MGCSNSKPAAFRIGDKVPDFSSESSAGPFNFYEYLGEVS